MDPIQSEVEDKFEILHKISEGGMGVVYKARHRLLDQISVIKVIRPQHADDKDLQQRFLNEARTASRLSHPNIAAIQDFFIGDQGNPYLVMEYIEGTTLKDILRDEGPMDLDLTLEVARQSLEALGFLHKRGYLHRDVSPDNLMLSRNFEGEPVVKLIDLGIAKNLEAGAADLTTTGMFMGKVRYSSPEQLSSSTDLDQRTDLYSFGVLFYELLTGQTPIRGERMNEIVACHLMGEPMPFAESDPQGRIPEGLRDVALRTLAKNRDDRVPSAEELIRLIAPYAEGPADDETTTAASAKKPFTAKKAFPTKKPTLPTEVSLQPTVILERDGGRRGLRRWMGAAAVVVALGLGWWLWPALEGDGSGGEATTAAAKRSAREDFRQALLEIEAGRWSNAARLLRGVVEVDPQESRETVEVRDDGTVAAYLPHYYLGLALYEMRNYVLALDAWKTSESQGVVQGTEAYPRLQKLLAASNDIAVEPAIRKVAKSLEAADEYAGMVRELLDDTTLQPILQSHPKILGDAQTLLLELETITTQVDDATHRRDLRALQAADTAALDIKAKLVDLALGMLKLSEGK